MLRTGARMVLSAPLRVRGRAAGSLHVGMERGLAVPRAVLTFFSALAAEVSWLIARKEADTALRVSAERYRHLFENALDAIFILGPADGIISDANLYQAVGGKRAAPVARRALHRHIQGQIQPDGGAVVADQRAAGRVGKRAAAGRHHHVPGGKQLADDLALLRAGAGTGRAADRLPLQPQTNRPGVAHVRRR